MRTRRRRGWVLAEATIALSVIALLLASAHVAGAAEARFLRESARRDAVREAAAAILERARARRADLAPGEERVDVDVADASAQRTVEEVAPGLLRVTAVVTGSDAGATLTTLVATGPAR